MLIKSVYEHSVESRVLKIESRFSLKVDNSCYWTEMINVINSCVVGYKINKLFFPLKGS